MSVRGIFFDDRSQPKGAVQKARKDAGFFFKQSDHLSYLKASLRVLLRKTVCVRLFGSPSCAVCRPFAHFSSNRQVEGVEIGSMPL